MIYSLMNADTAVSNRSSNEQQHSLYLVYLLMTFIDMPKQYSTPYIRYSLSVTYKTYLPKEKIDKWVNKKPI